MTKSTPKLKIQKPKSTFEKPLQADFKGLFKSLTKAIGHTSTGKWEELGNDAVEGLSAIGLASEPAELAFLLIHRSVTRALFDLIGESASQHLADEKKSAEDIEEKLNFFISFGNIKLDKKFFERPAELPFLNELKPMLQVWLERHGVESHVAISVTDRLPAYFVYSLNQEWRKNVKSYRPLIDCLETPFSKAGDREWSWTAYAALLQRRIDESVFDESFSLRQIYVSLNAYYLENKNEKGQDDCLDRHGEERRRVVVRLEAELEAWLNNPSAQDAIRVLSGGPGSGKSSFARIFAARIASSGKLKILYIPLHLIDPTKDLVDEVGRFVCDEGVLEHNPLDINTSESNLLIVFDGLDELASQGKAAAETARAFIREVDRTVERRNSGSVRLRVVFCGREVVVQDNESEFRRPRQVLNLLPYITQKQDKPGLRHTQLSEKFHDPTEILKKDLRQEWWKNYGRLSGKNFNGLPKELMRPDLEEITAQPLLNYLVALSYTREKINFKQNVNINEVYKDLVCAVHERGYEKSRPYAQIRHMTIENFFRVLEEIGLAAWHGDGRSTTVREIEEHCSTSGVGDLLEDFADGAEKGVTRLLAAFFFRQYGQRSSGDRTFVFTHKSFGEYLSARRLVRAMERINRERLHRHDNPGEGWDDKMALEHWVQICGPSAITEYLNILLVNELKLREPSQIERLQECFTKLFNYMLRHWMPMEKLNNKNYKENFFQSRNAEEALMVALNSCAKITRSVSQIDCPEPTTFGAWFKRIQGQRTGSESVRTASCLSFLNLSKTVLDIADLYGANLEMTNLKGASFYYACLRCANLQNADLEDARLNAAQLENVNLGGANLKNARFRGADLQRANLQGANLEGANFFEANFNGANLKGANLKGASLKGANLKEINRNGAIRTKSLFEGASFEGASFEGADLEGANLEGADLERANIEGANLKGANLKGAKLPKEKKEVSP